MYIYNQVAVSLKICTLYIEYNMYVLKFNLLCAVLSMFALLL